MISAFQGKYSGAESLYERAQVIQEKLFGLEHTGVVSILNNRALLRDAQVMLKFQGTIMS